ncbi:tetratricopeptide repeat protein [Acinetobacter vivianii]|uniref:Tetratricopeptide repeat protein n=1 Tax=Acinetobacter vivianii TaxID=1776742 RepID=A0AAJ6NHT6_9GAMM|nr:tetratricopeptide repeat protein [Acinetobacter vivianii]WDZ50625.1 tetratricopeptide repeat protein [Acinetobacter vivianii]
MKKLLIASLITLAIHTAFAADNKAPPTKSDPLFTKATQLYETKDYAAAYQEMQRLANTGNMQAIHNLGYMTEHGQGTVKDEKKAVQYYLDASNKGYGPASFSLAQAYHKGSLGLSKDPQKYKEYLNKASSQGSDEATVEFADLLFRQGKPEYDQLAIQRLLPLLRKDYYPAKNLKAVYDLGIGVKNKNPFMQQQAVESLKELAKKDYAPSLMILGNMLANGNIIGQDLEQAKNIFARLAAANYPNAKESLAKVDEAIAAKKAAAAQTPKK